MMFGARATKRDALREHPVVGAEEGRVGLHREPALAPAGRLERGQEERRRPKGHLLDDGPREVDLGGVRSFVGQRPDTIAPVAPDRPSRRR